MRNVFNPETPKFLEHLFYTEGSACAIWTFSSIHKKLHSVQTHSIATNWKKTGRIKDSLKSCWVFVISLSSKPTGFLVSSLWFQSPHTEQPANKKKMNSSMLSLNKKAEEARKWKLLVLLIMNFSFIFTQDSWQTHEVVHYVCKAMATDWQ